MTVEKFIESIKNLPKNKEIEFIFGNEIIFHPIIDEEENKVTCRFMLYEKRRNK